MSKSRTPQPSRPSSGVAKATPKTAVKQSGATTNLTTRGAIDASAKKTQPISGTSPTEKSSTTARPATRAEQPAKSPLPTTKGLTRDAAKYERRQAARQQQYQVQRRTQRSKFLLIAAAVLVVVLAGGLTTYYVYAAHHPASASTASASSYTEAIYNSSYQPVENIYCDQLEGSVMHIHAHVSIYINGAAWVIPQYVGIPQDSSGNATCFYWLHTHDSSGIIHMESPIIQTFKLGQFLNEWNQEFSSLGFPDQALLSTGWTAWINGHKYNGDIDSIPMTAHALITIAYNSPKAKPDTVYAWPAGL